MDRSDLDRVEILPVPPGYTIRPFRPADWEPCIDLMLQTPDLSYSAGPWDRQLCLASLSFCADERCDYPAGRGQLAFWQGELVAMAMAGVTGYLNQAYTRGDHQRRGLASALITRVLAALHQCGAERCFLMVYDTNLTAMRCYEKLGFAVVWSDAVEGPD